jgi:8-oxo-dGTP diphosphatase
MRICAGALLVRGRDILLAKRADDRTFYPGMWDVIGGHCEADESPADTLVREVVEEIGVKPTRYREIAVLAEPAPSEQGDARYHVFVVSTWDGGEPRLVGTEHSELRWMSVADALTLRLAHPGYRELFPKLFASS